MNRDLIQGRPSPAGSGRRTETHRESLGQADLALRPGRITFFLAAAIVLLTIASLAGQIARYQFGFPTLFGLVDLFYIDAEANLPTLFQVFHLLLSALLLSVVGIQERRIGSRHARYWFVLAAGFLLMAIDEGAMLHDRLPLHRFIDGAGAWTSLWIFPGILMVGAAAYYFRRFVSQMPLKDGLQIVAAGALFVGGAIGVETVIATAFDPTTPDWKLSFQYVLMVHLEELLEMCGILMFNRFLLYRIAERPPVALAARQPGAYPQATSGSVAKALTLAESGGQ